MILHEENGVKNNWPAIPSTFLSISSSNPVITSPELCESVDICRLGSTRTEVSPPTPPSSPTSFSSSLTFSSPLQSRSSLSLTSKKWNIENKKKNYKRAHMKCIFNPLNKQTEDFWLTWIH